MDNTMVKQVEALLFVAGEPLSRDQLARAIGCSKEDIGKALTALGSALNSHGIRVLIKDNHVSLVTAPETSETVERLIKSELIGELSKAALETLTIIVYKHPVSRPDIDYIRGVNSSFTLRALTMRGLVERVAHKSDARAYLYQPTIDFMKFLGISSLDELPEYTAFRGTLEKSITEEHTSHHDTTHAA